MTRLQFHQLDRDYPNGWTVAQEGHSDRLVIRDPNVKEIGTLDDRQKFLQFIWAPDGIGEWGWNLTNGGLVIGLCTPTVV